MVNDFHRTSGRRRNRGQRSQQVSSNVVQSNCGEIRMRGTLGQVIEKYKALAADAVDKMQSELYLQHAEHYTRTLLEAKSPQVTSERVQNERFSNETQSGMSY